MAKKNNSDFIDVAGLLRQYTSRWYLFVISVIVCAGLAFLYTRVRQQDYAVRANLLIESEKESPLTGGMGDIASLFGSSARVDDEIYIISSHSLYYGVVKDLGINIKQYVKTSFFRRELAYPENPLIVTPQAGMMDTLQRSITFKIRVNDKGRVNVSAKMKKKTVLKEKDLTLPCTVTTPIGSFTFAKSEYYPADEELNVNVSVSGYDGAAEDLSEDVLAEIASKRSNVIELSINTPNDTYGKDILNQIIANYNARGILEQRQQNELTASFIDGRLQLLTRELSDVESRLQDYKQSKGIIGVGTEAKYQIEKKGRVETELLAAETQAEIIKLTSEFLNDPKNAYSLVPATLDNEGLQRAIEAHNKLVLDRIAMTGSARPDNVALKLLSEQIDASRRNIGTSVARAYETAMVAVNDLRREMRSAEGNLAQIPAQEREYLDLSRQQSVKQSLLIFLLQRSEETAMLIANAYPKGSIVDRAYTLSEPLGLKNKIIYLLGIFFGLLIPPVWLYLRKLIHNRFETRSDVEHMTDVPILGEMCIDSTGRSLVVSAEDTSATAELFRLMRSNLLFVLNDPRDKVVLMTSTSSGEGKSFISINLAASLALLGKKVVLVGMDIRNPRLAEYLDIAPRFGLTQYLSSSNITLPQITTALPSVPGLDVICAGPVPPNPAELLLSTKVDDLFTQLRADYDYVIVDTAPIGLVSDTFTLDRIADAAIYVCRANYTSMSDLELINDIYEQHRLKKVSLVINGTASKKTYGYGRKK
ncbi:MAG: polysaccharide biosynthesis tyrosine autokinase [Muribaculaceae bacterium]|nr:polysaccharide biosynthesis tyrosine autokinase [Muribaculaceae bacterium]